MSVVIPYVFVGGTGNKARASEVNANFLALKAKFTEGSGGIGDEDISATAGIKASRLPSVGGTRVTATKLEADAVDLRVLKADATAGAPNAAVNTAAHIKDGIITPAKIVAGSLAKDRLKVAAVGPFVIAALSEGAFSNTDTGLLSTTAYPIRLDIESAGVPGGNDPAIWVVLGTRGGKFCVRAA